MKLGEWLKDNKDILLSELEIPSELDGDLIGLILSTNYSERIIFEPYEDLTGVEVAKFLNMKYNQKWEDISEYLENAFDIGVVNKKEIDETNEGEQSGEQVGNLKNKESAFNTNDFVNKDSQESNINNQSSNTSERTRIEKYYSYHTGNQQVMNYDNEQISHVVSKDIVNELCLKIY